MTKHPSWDARDDRLYVLTIEPSIKRHNREIRAEIQRMAAGNSTGKPFPLRILDIHLDHLKAEAEDRYSARNEVWTKKGCRRTPEIVRDIGSAVEAAIDARVAGSISDAFTHTLTAAGLSQDQFLLTAAKARIDSVVRELKEEWRIKIEKEALEMEYAASQPKRFSQTPVIGTEPYFVGFDPVTHQPKWLEQKPEGVEPMLGGQIVDIRSAAGDIEQRAEQAIAKLTNVLQGEEANFNNNLGNPGMPEIGRAHV